MASRRELENLLTHWSTLLGTHPVLGSEHPGRQLWTVTSTQGHRFVLKHVGPWRNLPLADQARILAHLSASAVTVAPFLITDDATVFGGDSDDSFVLIPWIDHESVPSEAATQTTALVGRALAELHQALAAYPWPVNSYTENFLHDLSSDDLRLPPDILEELKGLRSTMIEHLTPLRPQLVHGDLTPDNVLVSASRNRVGFIDLDHLPLAPRTWDLARYLSRCFRRETPDRALAAVTALVGGYHRICPLRPEETRALPALIATMHLLEASWTRQILDGELERRLLPEQEAELGSMLAALRWQFRHPELLEDAVG